MKRTACWAALSLAATLLSVMPTDGWAQKGKKKKGKKGDTEQVDGKKKGGKDKVKSVAEFTKDFKLDEGLFNLYQDTAKGSMYMHIPADAMDSEFIYFSQVEDGVVQSAVHNNLPLGRSMDELIRMVDALQFHEEHGEVCPANWQPGKAAMQATPEGVKAYLQEHASSL